VATLREIRRRIRGIRNVAQVTRAMQMVAASKMRRAQAQVLGTRPYAEKTWEVLKDLAAQQGAGGALHPLLEVRPEIKAIGLLLITADKGLCGAYNANMLRVASRFILEAEKPVRVIAVGRRGAVFMAHHRQELIAEFTKLPSQPRIMDVTPIAHVAMNAFLSGEVDELYLGYTRFINTLTQRPVIRRLLPLPTKQANSHLGVLSPVVQKDAPPPRIGDFIYEPDPQSVLNTILPRFTEIQIYQAILEALASEHSARMVAMRSATDNANALLAELTLSYHRARQSSITREMLDIAGGVEAMRQRR